MIDINAIEETSEDKPPRLVIYGGNGAGKSSFAAEAPDPIFADIENGLEGIKVKKHPTKSWAEMMKFLEALYTQEHDRKTLAIDTIDWLEKLMHEQIATECGHKSIAEVPYGKGYKLALDLWKQLLQALDDLREQKNMTIILIAHDNVARFDDPNGDSYSRYTLRLHEAAAGMVYDWADGVLFVNDKKITVKEDIGFNQKKTKAVASNRVLYTSGNLAFVAKNRANLNLPDEIPFIKGQSWNNFISAIGTGE